MPGWENSGLTSMGSLSTPSSPLNTPSDPTPSWGSVTSAGLPKIEVEMHRLLFYQYQVSDTNLLTEPMRHFDTASRVLMIHFHKQTTSDQPFIPQSKIVKAYWLALEKNVNTTVRLLKNSKAQKAQPVYSSPTKRRA